MAVCVTKFDETYAPMASLAAVAMGALIPDPRGSQAAGDAASAKPLQEQAWVTYQYVVSQGQEPGVVLSVRDLDRLIERLDGCKPSGWADLWLALAGAGAALAAGALVGALTLPAALAGTRDVLWALTGAGVVIFALCLFGYLTQRNDHGKEISELEKDLKLRKGAQG